MSKKVGNRAEFEMYSIPEGDLNSWKVATQWFAGWVRGLSLGRAKARVYFRRTVCDMGELKKGEVAEFFLTADGWDGPQMVWDGVDWREKRGEYSEDARKIVAVALDNVVAKEEREGWQYQYVVAIMGDDLKWEVKGYNPIEVSDFTMRVEPATCVGVCSAGSKKEG